MPPRKIAPKSNPKSNPEFHQNPNPNRVAIFLVGQLSGYRLKHIMSLRFIKEIYKWRKFIKMLIASPHQLWILSLFEFRSNEYNIRNFQVLSTDLRRTVKYGIETMTYRAPSYWAKLPSEYKLADSLTEFNVKVKKWQCDTCS